MIPALSLRMRVGEAYVDGTNVPVVSLVGPTDEYTVLLRGPALELEGVTIGEPVDLELRPSVLTRVKGGVRFGRG